MFLTVSSPSPLLLASLLQRQVQSVDEDGGETVREISHRKARRHHPCSHIRAGLNGNDQMEFVDETRTLTRH